MLFRPAVNVTGTALPVSPYGTPYLIFDALKGKEGVNQLFEYKLVLRSRNEFGQPTHGYKGLQGYVSKEVADAGGSPGSHLDLQAMIGTEITIAITLDGVLAAIEGLAELGLSTGERQDERKQLSGGGVRYLSGVVRRVEQIGVRNRHALYQFTLVPSFWLLTKTSDYKIFQNQSVTHIIDEVLADYAFAVDTRYAQEYPLLDYQVQYGETDFDFVTRLMAEFGINYHFEYPEGKQLLVLSDHVAAFTPLPAKRYQQLWVYPPEQGFPLKQEYIERFEPAQTLTSGSVRLADYQFKQPQSNQSVRASQAWETAHGQAEVYEWTQGDYLDGNEEGATKAQLKAQQRHQHGLRAEGYGRLRGLAVGHTFELHNHPNTDSNHAWLVLGTELDIHDLSIEDANTMFYDATARFIVQPATEPLLPDPVNTLPKAYTQTATVVGPAEEEIHVDQYGRVRVQFHWDEYGAKDEHSTCWLRVSSAWAGMNYGAMHTPRVGQEVIVNFFNADPDMPFISGRLTNPEHMPLWALPSQKALSGFKSKEINGGKNNHLIMDDTPGETQVQLGSEHQHSQLNLGYITRVPTALGRSDHRGEGFELRSDGWGAIRADKGLLLTTHGRGSAVSHVRDLSEASSLLQNAHNQQQVFNQLAIKAKADERSLDDTAQVDLKQQHAEVAGTEATVCEEQRFVELQTPQMVLSSLAGIALATEENVHIATQGHAAITAQKDFSASVGKRLLASVGEGISLFTQRLGIKLFASKGKVEIQAHSDNVEIVADKTVKIISANNRIEVAAEEELLVTCGGAYIRLKGGNIEIHAPGVIDQKGASFPHMGPVEMPYPMPLFPEGACIECLLNSAGSRSPVAIKNGAS